MEVDEVTEDQLVMEWRRLRLERVGLDEYWATKISRTDFDIEAACRMIRQGCDPEMLFEIAD